MDLPGWRLHRLKGKDKGGHAIWVSGNWRMTFEFENGNAYVVDYEDYHALQSYLMQKPDAGAIVRSTEGVRKVRWAPVGHGKSSGVRAIYYWKKPDHEIRMLTISSKSEKSATPNHILKQIAGAIDYG